MNHFIQLERPVNDSQFLADVMSGLAHSPKRLSCKHFYDARGSSLFDQICELDEYYVTRAELSIMQRDAAEMGRQIGANVRLVEYGSGSSIKTRILLDHLSDPAAYVPVDISRDHLLNVSQRLQDDYPDVEVLPVVADFTQPYEIPEPTRPTSHTAVYFPGSTIGNFEKPQAQALLRSVADLCGEGGGLLVGIDLDKDPAVLQLAYDDPAGVTAEFNLNLLHRMRNELQAELDLDGFEHFACYNPRHSRIEIYIRSQRDQTIRLHGRTFHCAAGELIHTEYSHKYTVESFSQLAVAAGLTLRQSWTDQNGYFAVLHCVVQGRKSG